MRPEYLEMDYVAPSTIVKSTRPFDPVDGGAGGVAV